MITGKYWLRPGLDPVVVDVSANEHSVYAKQWLLKLNSWDDECSKIRMLKTITTEQAQAALDRGIDKEIVNYLWAYPDPRPLMIERFNWIRVRGHTFQVKSFDLVTACFLRDLKEFWDQQVKLDENDVIEITDFSCTENWRYDILVKDLFEFRGRASHSFRSHCGFEELKKKTLKVFA
jgi:hypothetical protein